MSACRATIPRPRLPQALVALLLALSGSAHAQTTRPALELRHTDTPPVIDGKLDDPCWRHARHAARGG